jgi:hypothetical protein
MIQAQGGKRPEPIFRDTNAFAFASIGMKQDLTTCGPRGIFTLRLDDKVMHRIGVFEPNGEKHGFAQIYMPDLCSE